MLGTERLAGAVLWCCLVGVNWFQAQFIHPIAEWWLESVLGTWEESVKSLIRELFAQVIRIVNYVLNALFSWFPGYQSVKTTFQKPSAWQSWWEENRQSTFNALIDREKSMKGGTEGFAHQAEQAVKSSQGQGGRAELQPPPFASRQGLHRLFSWKRNGAAVEPEASGAAAGSESGTSKKRKMGSQKKKSSSAKGQRIAAHKKMKRNGSELFDRPAGWAVQEKAKRGFLEDLRIGAELATTAVFDAVRWLVRKALFMPEKQTFSPLGFDGRGPGWIGDGEGDDESPERPERPHHGPRLRRTNSFSDWESLHNVWTAAEVIKAAGYPLEQHTVTTSDGYVLRMERLPREGGRDVVFFMHGILDTSMGWVSNGVTGSQAFAAFDQGFDVWLGNSRANPPRLHERQDMMGAAYWHFTVNELGEQDIAAQLDHIHTVKCDELNEPLGQPSHTLNRRRHYKVRKSYSDTALSSLDSNGTVQHLPDAALPSNGRPKHVVEQAGAGVHGAQPHGAQPHSRAPDQAKIAATAPQADAGPQPKRRFGLLGLMKRNKSGTRNLPSVFSRTHAAAKQGANPQAIIEDDDGDLFASPRSQLEVNSPQAAARAPQSGSSEEDLLNMESPHTQHMPYQHPPQHQPSGHLQPPESPFAAAGDSTSPGPARSPPMRIPSSHQQPNLSNSAPSHSDSPLHQWGASSKRPRTDHELYQQPGPSHANQADLNGHGEAGRGAHAGHSSQAPRQSALHSSRSKSRGDFRSDGRRSIRWNNSHESLAWSSQEDLAQLQPDRASADGVERPPEEGFTVESATRRGPAGFVALSAPAAVQDNYDDQSNQQQDDGDLVAAEQAKVKGEHGSRPNSHRGSHTGSQQSDMQEEPYRLRAVGHSLGGASLLIYAVTRAMKGKPTHLARLILLTPAGFQQNYPKAAAPFLWILPPLVWALHWARPGVGAACYIPSSLLRYVTFKLTVDMQQIPALNEIVRAGIRVLLNGDSSQWDRAMQMPHYNTRSMPSISFHTGMHLIQWIRTGRFTLYKYRTKEANREQYGSETPTDIADNYSALKMPVDIMAGKSDGVIARENVLMHYQKLQEANCSVTYKEFDFGHLDFTFAVKDDLRHYVLSRLLMDS